MKRYGVKNPKALDYLLAIVFVLVAYLALWASILVTKSGAIVELNTALEFLIDAVKTNLAGDTLTTIMIEGIVLYTGAVIFIVSLLLMLITRRFGTFAGIFALLVGFAGLSVSAGVFGHFYLTAMDTVPSYFLIGFGVGMVLLLGVIICTLVKTFTLLLVKSKYVAYRSKGKDNNEDGTCECAVPNDAVAKNEENNACFETNDVIDNDDIVEEIEILEDDDSIIDSDFVSNSQVNDEENQVEQEESITEKQDMVVNEVEQEAQDVNFEESEQEQVEEPLDIKDDAKQDVEVAPQVSEQKEVKERKKREKKVVEEDDDDDDEDENSPNPTWTFEERLAESSPKIQEYFSELKDYFEEYGFRTALTKKSQAFYLDNIKCAMITITKRHGMMVYYKLNAGNYAETPIPVKDVSDIKKYENTPCRLMAKNNLAIKRAKKLVRDLMEVYSQW